MWWTLPNILHLCSTENNVELSKSSGVRREAQVTARLWAIVEATRQWHSFGCSALTPHQLEVIFFAGLAPSANSMNLLRRVINTLPKVSVFLFLYPSMKLLYVIAKSSSVWVDFMISCTFFSSNLSGNSKQSHYHVESVAFKRATLMLAWKIPNSIPPNYAL